MTSPPPPASEFTAGMLEALRTCPVIDLPKVQGVSGCPSIRACPTCGILLHHNNQACKKVVCPRCSMGFCFVCLKLTEVCLATSGPYKMCSGGVAKKQTQIPVWEKK